MMLLKQQAAVKIASPADPVKGGRVLAACPSSRSGVAGKVATPIRIPGDEARGGTPFIACSSFRDYQPLMQIEPPAGTGYPLNSTQHHGGFRQIYF
jgi:hypothetical protein